GSSGDTGRIRKDTGRIRTVEATRPDAVPELHHATFTPPPVHHASVEEQQAAQLAEEAAFDLIPDAPQGGDSSEPVEEVATPQIPTTDLSQQQVPLFSDLPNDAFIDLLEQLTFRRVATGESVIREGDLGKSIYVLASGHCRVVKGLGTNHAIELAKLDEGAFFGEMALL